jgi:NitT/TauT family transport system ATP-binding protein
MVAGLAAPSSGQVIVAGHEPDGPSPDTSIVFQGHGPFPWMTARTNVEFTLKAPGVPRTGRRARAAEMPDLTGLSAFARRYPHE